MWTNQFIFFSLISLLKTKFEKYLLFVLTLPKIARIECALKFSYIFFRLRFKSKNKTMFRRRWENNILNKREIRMLFSRIELKQRRFVLFDVNALRVLITIQTLKWSIFKISCIVQKKFFTILTRVALHQFRLQFAINDLYVCAIIQFAKENIE